MDTRFLEKVEKDYIRDGIPTFDTGDTVSVHYKITSDKGDKKRIQVFTGIVLAIKNSGTSKTFTVRKIGANGIGVERIFPLHSPNIAKLEVKKRGKTRKSKLYYMRGRVGKAAMKIQEGKEGAEGNIAEEVIEESATEKKDQE